jgi:hypothetical protein
LALLLSFLRNRRLSKRARHTWRWSAISPSAAGKSSDSRQVDHLFHATELIKQFSKKKTNKTKMQNNKIRDKLQINQANEHIRHISY